MKTFKLLGLLLTYPEGTVYSESNELLQTLRSEALLPEKIIKKVETFLTAQKVQDLMAVQEDYVETFDRGRAHCLHLFEHIHGESRDRGQAMVDLSETYAAKGLHIDSSELPDYLPLFMEYLSRCELQDATELLGEAIDVIAVIGAKLKKRKSPYADIFTSIEALSVVKADTEKIKTALREAHKDPETLEELDKQWKEAEAFTGNSLSDVAADSNTCNAFPNTMEALNKIAGSKK
ncbi:MAG: nitrate reductase molybdenum cofactor assembly chaperone [Candidatus Marinimicrobia bacterium]|jgi:nitrate reductase delta subunit|nr:nitrate reductase molybdenum cofactor assembly chaperone [Candidatus Neomarinimicrobiota bacterium]|tara:strand:- start:284 stop:988 length:705 start_codon:yes stop_codon:yes gene_type:complete